MGQRVGVGWGGGERGSRGQTGALEPKELSVANLFYPPEDRPPNSSPRSHSLIRQWNEPGNGARQASLLQNSIATAELTGEPGAAPQTGWSVWGRATGTVQSCMQPTSCFSSAMEFKKTYVVHPARPAAPQPGCRSKEVLLVQTRGFILHHRGPQRKPRPPRPTQMVAWPPDKG